MFMQAFYLCVVVARIGRHIHNYKNVSEEIKVKDEVHELQAAEHEEEKEPESNQVALLEIIPQDYSITCLA